MVHVNELSYTSTEVCIPVCKRAPVEGQHLARELAKASTRRHALFGHTSVEGSTVLRSEKELEIKEVERDNEQQVERTLRNPERNLSPSTLDTTVWQGARISLLQRFFCRIPYLGSINASASKYPSYIKGSLIYQGTKSQPWVMAKWGDLALLPLLRSSKKASFFLSCSIHGREEENSLSLSLLSCLDLFPLLCCLQLHWVYPLRLCQHVRLPFVWGNERLPYVSTSLTFTR